LHQGEAIYFEARCGEVRTSPEIVLHLSWKVMHLPLGISFNDGTKWKCDGCLGSTLRDVRKFFCKIETVIAIDLCVK
jgi:hypothetical protein